MSSSTTLTTAFDPAAVKLIIAGHQFSKFADGTAITISKNEDSNNVKVGVDGYWAGAINRDLSGSVKFTLLSTAQSEINFISELVIAGRTAKVIEFPMSFKDPAGIMIAATTCIFKKQGDVQISKEVNGIEFEFWVANAEVSTNYATGIASTVTQYVSSI